MCNYFKSRHCCLSLLLCDSVADLTLCLAVHACVPCALANTWASCGESEIPLQDFEWRNSCGLWHHQYLEMEMRLYGNQSSLNGIIQSALKILSAAFTVLASTQPVFTYVWLYYRWVFFSHSACCSGWKIEKKNWLQGEFAIALSALQILTHNFLLPSKPHLSCFCENTA